MKPRIISSLLALAAITLFGAISFGQQPDSAAPKVDRATAYYNFSMGHLYAELAQAYNNKAEYLNKAIEHYRAAIKADPAAGFITEELAELYVASGRLRDAVVEAEEALKQNPNDLNMRRLLGRIYTRSIGDTQTNRINEEMLKRAIEQYEVIAKNSPDDNATWLMLGRLYKVSQNSPESEKAYKKVLEKDPENEDALTGLAMVYADVGDTKSAADLLQKAAVKSPSLRTLTALAAAYEQLKDYESAAVTLRKALELAPQNPEIKRGLAQNLLYADKYDEAQTLFQQLVTDEPRDAQSYLRLSQIHRQKRQFDKAREAAKKAAELDPNSIEIRYNEVSLLEAEGKMNEAIEAMQGILTATSRKEYSPPEKSNRIILLERLGYLQRGAEQFTKAVETFREMAKLDEDQGARAAVHVIETYRQARETTKALDEAKAARDKYPNERAVLSMYAYLAADAGKGADAEKVAREAFGGKKDRDSFIAAAQIYERTKNWKEMAKSLDEAEKLSADKEEKEGIYFMRGAMYEKMKQFDNAEGEFRKVLASNPASSSALNYLGYMLADRNVRLAEAHQMISKALEQDPNNGAYLDSLGWVLFRMGKLPEAEDHLKRALERTGKDPTVYDHLGDVYFKQGKVKEAMLQWQRSLKEWEGTPASENDGTEVAKIQKKLEGAKVRVAKEGK